MLQWLRVLAVLTGDLDSDLSTHIWWLQPPVTRVKIHAAHIHTSTESENRQDTSFKRLGTVAHTWHTSAVRAMGGSLELLAQSESSAAAFGE